MLYRFKSLNNLAFADDDKFYLIDTLLIVNVKYKNGRNGIYYKRKFYSKKTLRKLAYKHRELVIKKSTSFCPF